MLNHRARPCTLCNLLVSSYGPRLRYLFFVRVLNKIKEPEVVFDRNVPFFTILMEVFKIVQMLKKKQAQSINSAVFHFLYLRLFNHGCVNKKNKNSLALDLLSDILLNTYSHI